MYSELVSKSVGGRVLELSQFINPASHRVLHCSYLSLDCQSNSQNQNKFPAESLQECCESSSVSEKKKKSVSFCTQTYPIQTALANIVSQEVVPNDSSISREQNLLELSGGMRIHNII